MRCAITDGTAGSRPGWLVSRCAQLAADGVELIIVRERELEPAAQVSFTRRMVGVANGARVLVAGSPRLALAAGAAGVHLSTKVGELTVGQVRAAMPGAYVTRSCHTLEEVQQARGQGVDSVLFGPVFGKWVGPAEVVHGVGLERLAEAVAVAGEMPIYALGGVTRSNAALCTSAGIAAIRLFFGPAEESASMVNA